MLCNGEINGKNNVLVREKSEIPKSPQLEKRMLSFSEATGILQRHGIETSGVLAKSREEAVSAAAGFGCSVAMKVISQDVVHKTERNAVELGVRPNYVSEVYGELVGKFDDCRIDGILVQPMVKGAEFFVGASRDTQFGPVVTFGVGGTMVEVCNDVVHGVSEITLDDARGMIGRMKAQQLVNGFRGSPPLDIDEMAKLIVNVSELMRKNPQIFGLDLNPVVWNGKLHVIDPRLIEGEVMPEITCGRMPAWKGESLDRILSPDTCAIFSSTLIKEGSVPDTIMKEMAKNFKGSRMCFVNPHFNEDGAIMGRYRAVAKCNLSFFCSPDMIPGGIDAGIFINIPREVPPALRAFAEKGGRGAIIITDGFGDQGNTALEDEIRETAEKHRIAVLGPNCIGVVAKNANTLFIPEDRTESARIGKFATVIAQSGGNMVQVLEALGSNRVPVRVGVSCGNASCITVTDLLRYFTKDSESKATVLYVESVQNGEEFFQALRKACAEKPVIVLKGGNTEQGAEATMTHTGGVTKNFKVFADACRQAGAIVAPDLQAVENALLILGSQPRAHLNNLLTVAVGGGAGILAIDKSGQNGIVSAALSEETSGRLKQVSGLRYAHIGNPLDTLGSTDDRRMREVLEVLNSAPEVGAIHLLPYLQIGSMGGLDEVAGMLGEMNRKMEKPLVISPMSNGQYFNRCKAALLEQGVIVFDHLVAVPAMEIAMQAWNKYPNVDFRA